MSFPFPLFCPSGVAVRSQTTTWNPSDKGAGITLSTGIIANDTATGSGSAWNNVRATTSRSAGKRYFEVLIVTTSNPSAWPGMGDGSFSLTGNPPGYIATNSCGQAASTSSGDTAATGFFTQTGAEYSTTWANGQTMGWAIDFDAGKIWVSKNGVYVSSGAPSSGTSPLFTFTPNATLFPAFGGNTTSNVGTLVPWQTTYGAPSGFMEWDA